MSLDLFSVLVITALVVNVSGVLFILETLLRRDDGAGRVWSVAFLAGMLTTLAYSVWAGPGDAWWAVAIGNAAFVAGTGCMWLGCRRFNGRRMTWPSLLVGLAVATSGAAVAILGPEAGDWAGALWMFVALMGFAAAGCVECLRGELRRSRTAWVLAMVLGLQSLFYVARTIAFVAVGPHDPLFEAWFGTISTSFLTVTLTIVAVVVTSVVRATRSPVRGQVRSDEATAGSEGILDARSFLHMLAALCARAQPRGQLVAVTAVHIEDLDQMSTAFGSEVAGSVREAWRAGVRRHAPTNAAVAEDGQAGLVMCVAVASAQEARRQAEEVYRGVFDRLGKVGGGVIPVVGVGFALSDDTGYEPRDLLRVARETATRAAADVETSVMLGRA
jgi:hypothetical protein